MLRDCMVSHGAGDRAGRVVCGLLVAVAGWVGLEGGARTAQGASAGAQVMFQQDVTAAYVQGTLNVPGYSTSIFTSATGSGSLYSLTLHGALDAKDLPTVPPAMVAITSSTALGEFSTQSAYLGALSDAVYIHSSGGGTSSDSEAATNGPDERAAASSLNGTVLKRLEITRLSTGPLAEVPQFKLTLQAPAGAVHMVTTALGGGVARASVDVYLTGTIQDLSQPGQPVAEVERKEIFGGAIEGTAAWDSPSASGQYFLDLPEWTKLTGAHFNLNIGLQVTERTYAHVDAVPEPGTLGVMVGAVGLLVRRRRRCA